MMYSRCVPIFSFIKQNFPKLNFCIDSTNNAAYYNPFLLKSSIFWDMYLHIKKPLFFCEDAFKLALRIILMNLNYFLLNQ